MTFLDLLLGVLCAYRLTQVAVYDGIAESVRCWLANRSRWLDELLACPHCTGFWCAVVTAALLWVPWWPLRVAVWAFALAGGVSLIEHATHWLETGD